MSPKATNINQFKYDINKIEAITEARFEEIVSSKNNKTRFLNKFDIAIISIIVITCTLYYLTSIDSVFWHLTAIGRLLLIKVIPFYDWRLLKNKQCLIERSEVVSNSYYDCGICENIRRIDVYEDIDEDVLEDKYVNLDTPVILTDVLNTWPKNAKFLESLKSDDDFYYSYPCKLSTNIIKHFNYIGEVLERTSYFDEFYLHFQNCNFEAMRGMRKFTFRPAVVPKTFSPTLYNWLIWNKSYNTSNFKPIQLVEKLSVFGQLQGSTNIHLVPRSPCEYVCPILNIKIFSGEILVFTNAWDLEYTPGEVGENVAIILEIRD